jgi:hypothetical protein
MTKPSVISGVSNCWPSHHLTPWCLWAVGDFSPSPSSPSARPTWDRAPGPIFSGHFWDDGAMGSLLLRYREPTGFTAWYCHPHVFCCFSGHVLVPFWSQATVFVAWPNCNSTLT